MTKVILVNGLFVHDSGKTWFSTALAKYLMGQGYRVSLYKPVAGHSAWTQYHTVIKSKALKLLLGSDVLTYLDLALIRVEEIPITNPVDVLMGPLDVAKYINVRAFRRYLVDSLDHFKQMILTRITSCEDGSFEHFIIRSNLNHLIDSLVSDLTELSKILNAKDTDVDDLVKMLRGPHIEGNLNVCLKRKCEGVDLAIVESFNDAFTPYFSLLEHIDMVISVAHGRAIIFEDLRNIKTLVIEMINSLGDEGLKSSNIIDKLTPSQIIGIPPRASVTSAQEMGWGRLMKLTSS